MSHVSVCTFETLQTVRVMKEEGRREEPDGEKKGRDRETGTEGEQKETSRETRLCR